MSIYIHVHKGKYYVNKDLSFILIEKLLFYTITLTHSSQSYVASG